MAGRAKPVVYNGKEYESKAELARILNINPTKLYSKIKNSNGNVDMAVSSLLYEQEQIKIGEQSMNKLVEMFSENQTEKESKEEPNNVPSNESQSLVSIPIYHEDFTFSDYRPKYIQVNSIEHLVHELKNIPEHTINLIDYENVKDDNQLLEKYTTNEGEINIFFYNALIHSNKFYNLTKKYKGPIIQVLIYDVVDQLIDNLIMYYLGALRAVFGNKKFNIISKDGDFYRFTGFLQCNNIKCIGKNYIYDKETRYKFSLCKFITNTKLEHRNLVAVSELKTIFRSFYDKDLEDADIEDLIGSLTKFNMAERMTKGQYDWVKFHITDINEFVEKYKYE